MVEKKFQSVSSLIHLKRFQCGIYTYTHVSTKVDGKNRKPLVAQKIRVILVWDNIMFSDLSMSIGRPSQLILRLASHGALTQSR